MFSRKRVNGLWGVRYTDQGSDRPSATMSEGTGALGRSKRGFGPLALWVCAVALAGCAGSRGTAIKAPDPGALAKRVSGSFLRCVEVSGAECVQFQEQMRAWDAIALLAWMHEASPISILGALNSELITHGELEQVQKRFVKQTQEARVPIQGAGCLGEKAISIKEAMARLVPSVKKRFTQLGMLDDAMKEVVNGLAREGQQGVGSGQIVQVGCKNDPQLRYFAVVASVDAKLQVVGFAERLAPILLGEKMVHAASTVPSSKPKLMAQGADSYVHPWIDLEWELY